MYTTPECRTAPQGRQATGLRGIEQDASAHERFGVHGPGDVGALIRWDLSRVEAGGGPAVRHPPTCAGRPSARRRAWRAAPLCTRPKDGAITLAENVPLAGPNKARRQRVADGCWPWLFA